MSYISCLGVGLLLLACQGNQARRLGPAQALDASHLVVKGWDEEHVGHALAARDGLWIYMQPRPYFQTTGPGDYNGTDVRFVSDDVDIGRVKLGGWMEQVAFVGDFSSTGMDHIGGSAGYLSAVMVVNPSSYTEPAGEIPVSSSAIFPFPMGRAIRCGDVSGDGRDDVCTTEFLAFSPLVFSDAEPTEATADITWQADEDTRAAAVDLDGDGRDEVYVTNGRHVVRVDDQGIGELDLDALAGWSVETTVRALAVGDLEGDGQRALLVGFGREVWAFDASGVGRQVVKDLPDALGALATGDVDGDGQDELIIGAPPYVVIADGDGTWRSWWSVQVGTRGTVGMVLAVADLNLDGFDDVLVGSPGFSERSGDAGGIFRLDGPL